MHTFTDGLAAPAWDGNQKMQRLQESCSTLTLVSENKKGLLRSCGALGALFRRTESTVFTMSYSETQHSQSKICFQDEAIKRSTWHVYNYKSIIKDIRQPKRVCQVVTDLTQLSYLLSTFVLGIIYWTGLWSGRFLIVLRFFVQLAQAGIPAFSLALDWSQPKLLGSPRSNSKSKPVWQNVLWPLYELTSWDIMWLLLLLPTWYILVYQRNWEPYRLTAAKQLRHGPIRCLFVELLRAKQKLRNEPNMIAIYFNVQYYKLLWR